MCEHIKKASQNKALESKEKSNAACEHIKKARQNLTQWVNLLKKQRKI